MWSKWYEFYLVLASHRKRRVAANPRFTFPHIPSPAFVPFPLASSNCGDYAEDQLSEIPSDKELQCHFEERWHLGQKYWILVRLGNNSNRIIERYIAKHPDRKIICSAKRAEEIVEQETDDFFRSELFRSPEFDLRQMLEDIELNQRLGLLKIRALKFLQRKKFAQEEELLQTLVFGVQEQDYDYWLQIRRDVYEIYEMQSHVAWEIRQAKKLLPLESQVAWEIWDIRRRVEQLLRQVAEGIQEIPQEQVPLGLAAPVRAWESEELDIWLVKNRVDTSYRYHSSSVWCGSCLWWVLLFFKSVCGVPIMRTGHQKLATTVVPRNPDVQQGLCRDLLTPWGRQIFCKQQLTKSLSSVRLLFAQTWNWIQNSKSQRHAQVGPGPFVLSAAGPQYLGRFGLRILQRSSPAARGFLRVGRAKNCHW